MMKDEVSAEVYKKMSVENSGRCREILNWKTIAPGSHGG